MRSDQRISTWVALYLPISDGKRNIQQLQDYLLFGSLRAARGEVPTPDKSRNRKLMAHYQMARFGSE
jgi:hypothetical protein